MSAASLGNLLGNVITVATAQAEPGVGIWRNSLDITDPNSKVGRRLGDGSVKQGNAVIKAIREAFFAWLDKRTKPADDEEPAKEEKLSWELVRTLIATLSFTDFKTGECIATYEMIAKRTKCCAKTAMRRLAILRKKFWIDWVRRSTVGGPGERARQCPNGYLFEISRLPKKVQDHIRRILAFQNITLESHPDRRGSGPVPNKVERLAERLAKRFSRGRDRVQADKARAVKMAEADYIRSETELLGELPTHKWAAARHPDDVAAQEAYNARMGILPLDFETDTCSYDIGNQEIE